MEDGELVTRSDGENGCEHKGVAVSFDEQASRGLSSATVRRLWPRFFGTCPDCGRSLILYASFAHYIAGDW
jgi:hypothetical protein